MLHSGAALLNDGQIVHDKVPSRIILQPNYCEKLCMKSKYAPNRSRPWPSILSAEQRCLDFTAVISRTGC